MLAWSLEAARQTCRGVVAVLPDDAMTEDAMAGGEPNPGGWEADVVVAGGLTRSASVRAGLGAVPATAEIIAVHDAARPLVPSSVWKAVLAAVAKGADAAIPVLPVTDTVKEVASDGTLRTLDRSRLVAVQTPQAFRAQVLRRAHSGGTDATDDAALVEALGGRVERVAGSSRSMKITDPDDLVMAAALLGAAGHRKGHREGHGEDPT